MKTIIITGASRGIGREAARYFAERSHNVLANYNNSEKEARELKQEYSNIEIYKADVSKREEVDKMIEFCLDKFGNIDVLINNAGISEIKMFQDITEDDFDRMMNVNLKSVFNVTQSSINTMIRNKAGCIINISSIWGMIRCILRNTLFCK